MSYNGGREGGREGLLDSGNFVLKLYKFVEKNVFHPKILKKRKHTQAILLYSFDLSTYHFYNLRHNDKKRRERERERKRETK